MPLVPLGDPQVLDFNLDSLSSRRIDTMDALTVDVSAVSPVDPSLLQLVLEGAPASACKLRAQFPDSFTYVCDAAAVSHAHLRLVFSQTNKNAPSLYLRITYDESECSGHRKVCPNPM
jgi:hypothetical protein